MTRIMSSIHTFLSAIHLGAANGWDIAIIFVLLIGIFIYAFSLGRNRMVVILLSSYFSLSILEAMPWKKLADWPWLGIGSAGPSASIQILIFWVLIAAFYFLIPRSVLSSSLRVRNRGEASWLQLFLLGIVQTGMLVAVVLSFLPAKEVLNLTLTIRRFFVGSEAWFVWLTLPILTMVLMRRPKKIE